MKKKAIIVDIDGTVADCSHRLHYIQKNPKDWDSFYSDAISDKRIENVCDIVQGFVAIGFEVIFVTGRPERVREQTKQWLDNFMPDDTLLLMREDGDHREDFELKKHLYYDFIEREFDVVAVFEDRTQVVKMYRELGLTVLQVADGDF